VRGRYCCAITQALANSQLFRDALSWRRDDAHERARERLRASHSALKERATLLASEIARDFPEFTVHDGSHLDALWELADLVAGSEVELAPTEAYVLGGAILLHDLGLAVASYPEGRPAVRREPQWTDAVTTVLRQQLDRMPTQEEVTNCGLDIEHAADRLLLRRLHAERAEQIAQTAWTDSSGERHYLIEDAELRATLGPLIGKVAHSHWWPTAELGRRFADNLGPPPWCPPEWVIEPLKLACLLRLADAIHLDARRAPMFLRVLRRPTGNSAEHWEFQERLSRPYREDDRIVFTAGNPFAPEETDAWWLCHDTLVDADRWIREVDALLSDLSRRRFAARGIKGVEDPVRLAALVHTQGWTPVDTRIHISDVADLVSKLGGERLYGERREYVAVRELVQNASDAVRARRLMGRRGQTWGQIVVKLWSDRGADWLEVQDSGVGMSTEILTTALLDFGSSFWASEAVPTEFPGLLAGGFRPTGRYGIGFFSVFMLGEEVKIITRPFRAGEDATQVLEFKHGVRERPVLRPASEGEQMDDGGTRVQIHLKDRARDHLLRFGARTGHWSLARLCGWLCPALDIRLIAEEGGEATPVIEPSDWLDLSGATLLARIMGVAEDEIHGVDAIAHSARTLERIEMHGEVIGRLTVFPEASKSHKMRSLYQSSIGVVTVGGLRSANLNRLAGVLVGEPVTAARDVARPIISPDVLSQWASRQPEVVRDYSDKPEVLAEAAQVIASCKGDTGALPVAESGVGWLDLAAVAEWAVELRELISIQDAGLSLERRYNGPFELYPNVLAADSGWLPLVSTRSDSTFGDWPQGLMDDPGWGHHFGTIEHLILLTIADAWDTSPDRIVAVSEFSTDEASVPANIGDRNGSPVQYDHADIIRRP
jgi:Histidine kinase-, DNA gyrase B-, and HSP90-like ATPase